MEKTYGVLFVCLGNICRSPAAEAVMNALAIRHGVRNRLELDSAGTYGGHAGELPDRRMRVHSNMRGYDLVHRSRKVRMSDFDNFDLIVAMDDSNFDTLCQMAPTPEAESKVVRMTDYVKAYPQFDSVPDPYYSGAEGFETVLDLLEDGCKNLLESLPDEVRGER